MKKIYNPGLSLRFLLLLSALGLPALFGVFISGCENKEDDKPAAIADDDDDNDDVAPAECIDEDGDGYGVGELCPVEDKCPANPLAWTDDGCDACNDGDGDSFYGPGCEKNNYKVDCDENDPTVYPGAPRRIATDSDADCDQVSDRLTGVYTIDFLKSPELVLLTADNYYYLIRADGTGGAGRLGDYSAFCIGKNPSLCKPKLSSDGSRIIYIDNMRKPGSFATVDKNKLLIADAAPGSVASSGLIDSDVYQGFWDFAGPKAVVYLRDFDSETGLADLYFAPVDRSSSPIALGSDINPDYPPIGRGGAFLFQADHDSLRNRADLYYFDSVAGGATLIAESVTAECRPVFASDAEAYYFDNIAGEAGDLYLVDLSTGTVPTLVDTEIELELDRLPGGGIIYRKQNGGLIDLYRVPAGAPASPELIGENVADYIYSPDKAHLLFSGETAGPSYSLTWYDISGAASYVIETGEPGVIEPVKITFDNSKVIYRKTTGAFYDIYTADLNAAAAPSLLLVGVRRDTIGESGPESGEALAITEPLGELYLLNLNIGEAALIDSEVTGIDEKYFSPSRERFVYYKGAAGDDLYYYRQASTGPVAVAGGSSFVTFADDGTRLAYLTNIECANIVYHYCYGGQQGDLNIFTAGQDGGYSTPVTETLTLSLGEEIEFTRGIIFSADAESIYYYRNKSAAYLRAEIGGEQLIEPVAPGSSLSINLGRITADRKRIILVAANRLFIFDR